MKIARRALYQDLGIVAVFVTIGVFLQLHFGVDDYGIYHPDEIYQTIEPAHELAYGYGLRAWEWDLGARNALLPAMLAGVLSLARVVGLDQPAGYLALMRGFVALLYSSSAFAVYLLARRFSAGRWLALAGAVLFLFNPVSLYLGFRTLSEVISTPFILFGVYLALSARPITADKDGDKRARLWFVLGLSLLGISVLFRLQNALFIVPLVLPWRFQSGHFERYQLAMKVLVAWALIYGAIDWLTWGLPFASAGAYLRFNLILDGTTAYYGGDPVYYYPYYFGQAMGVAGLLMVVLPLFALGRARALFICAGVFLVVHSIFPHKQLRFVISTLPMLAALSAVGLQWGVERLKSPRARRVVGALAAVGVFSAAGWGITQVSSLSFGQLGHARTLRLPPQTSAFHYRDAFNRLLISAASKDDLCGLLMDQEVAVVGGGHTYFHRDRPAFHVFAPAPNPGAYNYVISMHPPQLGWRALQTQGEYTLYATDSKTCAPAPEYKSVVYLPVDEAQEQEDAPTP